MTLRSSRPKISVVTVSYNQGEFIRQNIESVLAQGYENFEHIVVDGGSTDDTVSILKEYPHLLWTSEADNGQSDGLNKGFARATGDIIAWLNSDDWYAPGCFEIIARELQTYPLLLGAAQQTDRNGTPTDLVPNYARTKYDLLRNWIPFAWLAQTSVFFTRELLEQVRLEPGRYLDESLDFCMDLDLWMRLADITPFSKRVDSVLSYFRVYESNKTGNRAVAGNKECMRVFRRYERSWNRTERSLSFIIPLTAVSEDTGKTISSILEQSVQDFEIVLVDRAESSASSKHIREYSLDLAEAINHVNIRCVKAESTNLLGGLNVGAHAAAANLLCFLQSGDRVDSAFSLRCMQHFSRDLAGLALPAGVTALDETTLLNPQTQSLDPLALLNAPAFFPNLVVRKVAFLEDHGFQHSELAPLAVKLLLLKLITRGWWVTVQDEMQLHAGESATENLDLEGLKPLIAARVLLDLHALFPQNEFQQFKACQNLCLHFPPDVIEAARTVLHQAPDSWQELPAFQDENRLQQMTRVYPECSAAWFYLAAALTKQSQDKEALQATARHKELATKYLGL